MAATIERTGRRDALLWFGVLAGPIAWAVQLVVNYALGDVIACTAGARFSGEIWDIGVRTWIGIVNGSLGGITLAALVVSVLLHRRLRDSDETTGNRARWMAKAGIINGVLFGIVIAVGLVPPILFESACRVSP